MVTIPDLTGLVSFVISIVETLVNGLDSLLAFANPNMIEIVKGGLAIIGAIYLLRPKTIMKLGVWVTVIIAILIFTNLH